MHFRQNFNSASFRNGGSSRYSKIWWNSNIYYRNMKPIFLNHLMPFFQQRPCFEFFYIFSAKDGVGNGDKPFFLFHKI